MRIFFNHHDNNLSLKLFLWFRTFLKPHYVKLKKKRILKNYRHCWLKCGKWTPASLYFITFLIGSRMSLVFFPNGLCFANSDYLDFRFCQNACKFSATKCFWRLFRKIQCFIFSHSVHYISIMCKSCWSGINLTRYGNVAIVSFDSKYWVSRILPTMRNMVNEK